jgi:nuclear GTP-binding protein
MKMLECDPFSTTFGPKAQRKRPKLLFSSVDDLSSTASVLETKYNPVKDSRRSDNFEGSGIREGARDMRMNAGQSRRIWKELYKVVDSSDVLIHVLDARDPLGTRCRNVENYIKKEANHKHLIFVLNKCDLVPTWVTVCIPSSIPYHSIPTLASQGLLPISL